MATTMQAMSPTKQPQASALISNAESTSPEAGTLAWRIHWAGVLEKAAALSHHLSIDAAHIDQQATYPPERLATLKRSGLLGLLAPQRYGGLGGDVLLANQIVEVLAQGCPSTAIILFQHLSLTKRILEWGTPEQQERWLPALTRESLGATAWSEPLAGAGKQHLATKATPAPEGGWLLNGMKNFTTNANLADLYMVLVETGGEEGESGSSYGGQGQSFFILDRRLPGLIPSIEGEMMGMRASATGFLTLQNYHASDDDVLGPLGDGVRVIAGVRRSGLSLGSVGVGIARACLSTAVAHARRRQLDQFQAIRFMLSDMAAATNAAAQLCYAAAIAATYDPELAAQLSLSSKLVGAEQAVEVASKALQVMGGTGYIKGSVVERLYRDARALALMGPTSEIARELLSAHLLATPPERK